MYFVKKNRIIVFIVEQDFPLISKFTSIWLLSVYPTFPSFCSCPFRSCPFFLIFSYSLPKYSPLVLGSKNLFIICLCMLFSHLVALFPFRFPLDPNKRKNVSSFSAFFLGGYLIFSLSLVRPFWHSLLFFMFLIRMLFYFFA